MLVNATRDPTGQSTQLAYICAGQLSALTLPAKVGTPSIPVINPDAPNQPPVQ